MPHGVRIVAGQGRPARAALRRTVLMHTPALLDRREGALMACVTRLRAALPATQPARLPGRRIRRITRRRLRTVVGRASRLLPEPCILHAQAADFFFQRGQPLQHVEDHLPDTGRRALPVFWSDHGIGASLQCRFHKPETTKSGVALYSVFSTLVNGYFAFCLPSRVLLPAYGASCRTLCQCARIGARGRYRNDVHPLRELSARSHGAT